MTSLKPPVVGLATLAYGAFAVAAVLLGASNFVLLEAAPLAVLVRLAALPVHRPSGRRSD